MAVHVHRANDSHLGGVHIEMTHHPVTEVLGGETNVTEAQLDDHYLSCVDPCLNAAQARELIQKLADYFLADERPMLNRRNECVTI